MSNLIKPNIRFVRPGGVNSVSQQLDPHALKQIDAFIKYLDSIKLPTAFKIRHGDPKSSPNGPQTGYREAVEKFFKNDDPDLNSDNNRKLKGDLQALANEPGNPAKSKPITDFVDAAGYASLYYDVQKMIIEDTHSLIGQVLLSNDTISVYLFARALFSPSLELNDAVAIYKNMKDEDNKVGGVKTVYNFIVYNAAVDIKNENKIETGNEPVSVAAKKIVSGPKLSFAEGVFSTKILYVLKQQIFTKDELKLVEDHKDKLNISDEDVPYLISYIKNSKIEIDSSNAEFYLAIALSKLKNNNISYSSDKPDELEDLDFSVKYYDDVKSAQSFNRESILCAAQLYYVMTLGDELGIFEVINTIITREMPSGRVDIVSKQLMKDLQQYFFNETFTAGNDLAPFKRTLPEERQMFYKQVFNAGAGNVIEGTSVNREFDVQMNTLFEEVIKYIEKVERSSTTSFVISKQNLFQAIEDLQYNLSSYCTGMVKVATPIINKELDFVVEKFLMNEDIRKQLAPNGNGSIWKVIENVQRGRGQNNTSLLRNKAVFTHKILTAIANYSPVAFDDENIVSDFISTVEALIINNSQLEDKQQFNRQDENDALRGHDWDNIDEDPSLLADLPGVNGSSNGHGSKDDWNF